MPCTLTLQNPTGERVAFKVRLLTQRTAPLAPLASAAAPTAPLLAPPAAAQVKTTSPKKYCVRPSSGIVEPGSSKEVQVIMQAQREYPPSLAGAGGRGIGRYGRVGACTAVGAWWEVCSTSH